VEPGQSGTDVERIVISGADAVVFGRLEHTAASTGRSFET
jgi:hypothetical protein